MSSGVVGWGAPETTVPPVDPELSGNTLIDSYSLLRGITRAQSRFILEGTAETVLNELLDTLLEITGSEYGFIGEVVEDDDGRFLRTHAVTNIAWTDELRTWFADESPNGLEFRNLQTLFGEVIRSGRTLISNDAPNDPRAAGLPDGHPPLRSFCGLPLWVGSEFVGMVGIANRPGGYPPGLVRELEAFLGTCSTIISAVRLRRLNEAVSAQAQLDRLRVEQYAAALALTPDFVGIAEVDGRVVSINDAGREMLGYSDGLVMGQIHTAWSRRQLIEVGLPTALSEGRWVGESEFLRSDGSPMHVSQAIVAPKDGRGEPMFVATIARDISEMKAVERLRRDFIATVSHELRTPLTSLRGSLGLLTGGVLGDFSGDVDRMLRIAQSNVDRLIGLVNDILDLERLERDETVELGPIDPRGLLAETVDVVAGAASVEQVKLVIEEDLPDGVEVNGDRGLLVQAMVNLAGNAVKFSPAGSTVTLSASLDDDRVVLAVADDGPGVDPADIERLFQPFVQLDPDGKNHKTGTGLGLAIVRRTAELHCGEARCFSDGRNGARFEIALPLEDCACEEGHAP